MILHHSDISQTRGPPREVPAAVEGWSEHRKDSVLLDEALGVHRLCQCE